VTWQADETDIDAGRKVLARFSPVRVGLALGLFLFVASFIGWQDRATLLQLAHLSTPSIVIGLVALLIVALVLSAPLVGVWRMLTGDGVAVWVADNRLRWSPWGSVPLDDLTGVRPAHYARGGWTQILLDRRSTILSPTIHTGLYAISRDDLIRAIETLKPGLRYPDEPV
jgi:hypothetical protein